MVVKCSSRASRIPKPTHRGTAHPLARRCRRAPSPRSNSQIGGIDKRSDAGKLHCLIVRGHFILKRPMSVWRSFSGVICGGMLAAVCIEFAGHAYADGPDDKFMNDLVSQGIAGDRDMLI